ncbi:MAG: hypothetical protein GY820_43970 [Gammaproteobacteria bacterium]|nr:hypothetical protein [Gammaproteobacteria bacterium]
MNGNIEAMSTVELNCSAVRQPEIYKMIRSLIEPIKVQPGCISCNAYQLLDKPGKLLITQTWSSQQALEQYVSSPEYRKTLALIDLSEQFPEINFYSVSQTGGLEFIRAIRLRSLN